MIVSSLGQNSNTLAGAGASGAFGGGLAGLFSMLLQSNKVSTEETPLAGLLSSFSGESAEGEESLQNILSSLKLNNKDLLSKVDLKDLGKVFDDLLSQIESLMPEGVDVENLNFDAPENANIKAVYETLQVELTVVKTKLEMKGVDVQNIGNLSDLAAAYLAMGMSAEEAREEAAKVDAAIKAMKDYLQGKDVNLAEGLGQMLQLVGEPQQAISEDVALIQNSISIEKTEITMRAHYSKTSFEYSSSLSDADALSNRILKGETLTAALDKNTQPTTQVQIPDVKTLAENTTDVDTLDPQTLDQNKPKVDPHAMASSAEGSSEIISEEEVIANNDKPQSSERNKPTTTTAEGTISKITGQKMFTASIQDSGVHLEYHETVPEEFDPLLDPAADDIQAPKERTFESLMNRPSSQTPWQQMMNRANVPNQASIQMKSLAQQGGGEVKFKLYPEELGEVTVELDVQNGRVRGSVGVERPEVAEHLARELHKLQEGLEDAGLTFGEEGLTFFVQDENNGGNAQHQQASDEELLDEDGVMAEAEAETSEKWVNPNSIVDVSV